MDSKENQNIKENEKSNDDIMLTGANNSYIFIPRKFAKPMNVILFILSVLLLIMTITSLMMD